MTGFKHKNLTFVQGIHPIHNFEVANDAALSALSVTSADLGRVARKSDDGSFHVLVDESPVTWQRLGSAVGVSSSTDNALARFDGTAGALQNSLVNVTDAGSITLPSGQTVDGRDVSVDGTKLDGIEALADVTDAANVEAAGAAMLSTGLRIYIDGSAGNDANAGTVGAPVATMAGAAARCPDVCSGAIIYEFVTAGNYAYTECPTVFSGAGRWTLFAASATRSVTVASGTADASTDSGVVKGTYTTNQYQGQTIEMTSGAALGYRRTIQQNTTTDLIPCRRFETAATTPVVVGVASGDTYTIYRAGVVLTGFTGFSSRKRVLLWDMAIAALTEKIDIRDCEIYAWGLELQGSTYGLAFTNCTGSFGCPGVTPTTVVENEMSPSRNLPWFADFGLSADLTTQAKHRGCGVWQSSFTSVPAASNDNWMIFHNCAFTGYGSWGRIMSRGGHNMLGGYHWGSFSCVAGKLSQLGRAEGAALTSGAVYRAALSLETAVLAFRTPVVFDVASSVVITAFDNTTIIFQVEAAGTTMTGTSSFFRLDRRSNCTVFGSITGTTTANSTSVDGYALGCLAVTSESVFDARAAVTLTSTGTRVMAVAAAGGTIRVSNAGSLSLTGSGGVQIEGGNLQAYGAITVTNGNILNNGGTIDLNANLTVTSAPGTPIRSVGGQILQRAGILSAVATAGDGLSAEAGARVRLRSGTNTVLDGAGAGNVGCRAKGGAAVWFSGAPTSVTTAGSATGALKVGVAAAVDNTVLTADGSAATDGAGTAIGHAA